MVYVNVKDFSVFYRDYSENSLSAVLKFVMQDFNLMEATSILQEEYLRAYGRNCRYPNLLLMGLRMPQ
jgi:hypothetical protein